MNTTDTATLILTRSTIETRHPSQNSGTIYKYTLHPQLHNLVMDFMERAAREYAITALGQICTNCGNCCRRENIFVMGTDIFRIAAFLKIPIETFRQKYLRTAQTWNACDGIMKHKQKKCPFLKKNITGKYECSIYPVRPRQCRLLPSMYPFCKKNAGELVDSIKTIRINGTKMELELDFSSPRNGLAGIPATPVTLIDTTLLNYMEQIHAEIRKIEEEPEHPIKKTIRNTLKAINRFIRSIREEANKPDFKTKLADFRMITEELTTLSSTDWHNNSLIDELWQTLHQAEFEAHQLNHTDTHTSDSPPPPTHDFLLRTDKHTLTNMTLFPEMVTLHIAGEDNLTIPCPIPLRGHPQLLRTVQNLLKLLTNLQEEGARIVLSEYDPPCYLCGECCSVYSVEIRPRDILRIAAHLNQSEKQFRKKYLLKNRFSWNSADGILKKTTLPGETKKHCSFLTKNSDNFYYCSIYTVRPEICEKYEPTNKLCSKYNNTIHWYRKISEIHRLEIQRDTIRIHTTFTYESETPYSIPWKNNLNLSVAVEEILKETQKIIDS